MNIKKLATSAALAATLALGITGGADAAWVDITSASPLSIPYTPPPPGSPDIVPYSPTPATQVFWTEDSVPANQNPNTIKASIESVFGLPAGSLFLTGQADDLTGSGTTFTGDPFQYIAIHYDAKELYFYYNTPITSFTISDLRQDISNVRAYGVVPIPAALPLMLGALAGLGLIARRRNKETV